MDIVCIKDATQINYTAANCEKGKAKPYKAIFIKSIYAQWEHFWLVLAEATLKVISAL